MKFVSNAGTDRVLDLVRPWLKADNGLDMVSPTLSIFAFGEVLGDAAKLTNARVVLPAAKAEDQDDLNLLGSTNDRAARNKLQGPWLARKLSRRSKMPSSAAITRSLGRSIWSVIACRN